MGETTHIQWTDHTFNPWWGCVKVSPGCEHCYAESLSKRFGRHIWGPAKTTDRMITSDTNWRQPLAWNRQAEAEGRSRRVFCASMSDVFEDHPQLDEPRRRLWRLIAHTPYLDWQLLTKRPENIAHMLPDDWGNGWPNVWLGTSVEDQRRADLRIPLLVRVPAMVHFLSVEPLLGPIDFLDGPADPESTMGEWSDLDQIDWVIVGGESGPNARPMQLDWVYSIIDQCKAHRVAFFCKQKGEVLARQMGWQDRKGGDPAEWPIDLRLRQFPSPANQDGQR